LANAHTISCFSYHPSSISSPPIRRCFPIIYFLIFSPSLRFLFFFQFKLGFGSVFSFPFDSSPSSSSRCLFHSSSTGQGLLGLTFFFVVYDRFSLLKLIHLFNGNLYSKKSNLSFAK
jgi:hypothetical protein